MVPTYKKEDNMIPKKHSLIAKIVLSIFFFLLVTVNCNGSEIEAPKIYHVVICWLKNPESESDRQKLIEATHSLKSIPGILSIEVGDMLPSERAIVDSSYDLGIIISFEDKESFRAFIDDPIHQKARKEKLVPLTSKAIVYDFVAP